MIERSSVTSTPLTHPFEPRFAPTHASLSTGRPDLRRAGPLDHGRSRMAGHDIDQDDLAAKRLDDLAADHFLTGVVAALDQYCRPDAADQFFRRIFIEYCNQVDGFERSKNFGARLHGLHGPACSLQTRD